MDWALAWIGYAGSPTRTGGWVSAGVQPLVVPFTGWVMTYGVRMDQVRSGPRTIDLLSDDAGEQASQFVLGAGLEKIDSWPAERLADVAERDFAQDPRRRRTHWHQLPGWRVVNDTASPVEPAEQLVTLCRDRAQGASRRGAQQRLSTAHAPKLDDRLSSYREAEFRRIIARCRAERRKAATCIRGGRRDDRLALYRLGAEVQQFRADQPVTVHPLRPRHRPSRS